MPVKISEVTALSCTSAGIERGSDAGTRNWAAKEKLEAAAGAAESSERSSSSTARHSTRAVEIGGDWNSSAAAANVPAASTGRAASNRKTQPTPVAATTRLPGAKSP